MPVSCCHNTLLPAYPAALQMSPATQKPPRQQHTQPLRPDHSQDRSYNIPIRHRSSHYRTFFYPQPSPPLLLQSFSAFRLLFRLSRPRSPSACCSLLHPYYFPRLPARYPYHCLPARYSYHFPRLSARCSYQYLPLLLPSYTEWLPSHTRAVPD